MSNHVTRIQPRRSNSSKFEQNPPKKISLLLFLRSHHQNPMAVRATLSRFPVDQESLESSGLPWGVTVTPFAQADEHGTSPAYGGDGDILPRCEDCWAYFNSYCELEQWAWTCSLCGALNGLTSRSIERYSQPQSCAEMFSSFIDLKIPGEFSF